MTRRIFTASRGDSLAKYLRHISWKYGNATSLELKCDMGNGTRIEQCI